MDKVSENPFKTEKQSRIVHRHTALMTDTALFVTIY